MTNDLARLGRLTRKELSEILRDRRTVITLVLMPILLYPLLSVAFRQFFLASRLTPGQGTEYRLGFTSKDELDLFNYRLIEGTERLKNRPPGPSAAPPKETASTETADEKKPRLAAQVASLEELKTSLHAGHIDAIARLVPPLDPRSGLLSQKHLPPGPEQLFNFEIIYVPQTAGALGLMDYIDERMAAANEI